MLKKMLKKCHIMITLKTEYQDKQGHKKLEWDHQEGQTNFKDRAQSSRSKTENNQMQKTSTDIWC